MRRFLPTKVDLSNTMYDEFNKVIDEFFKPANQNVSISNGKFYNPKVNAYKKGDKYTLDFVIPFAKKEDINIEVTPDSILVVHVVAHQDEEVKDEDYIIREITRGSCTRRIQLGDDVDLDSIKADFKDGVLNLTFDAKQKEPKARRIAIA